MLYQLYVLRELIKKQRVMKIVHNNPVYWDKLQRKRIQQFVKKIYDIPFYHTKFSEAGIKPSDIVSGSDFMKLPTVDKTEYKEWMNSVPKDQLHNVIVRSTSGSTGIPLKLYQTKKEMAEVVAIYYCCGLIQNSGYRVFRDSVLQTFGGKSCIMSRFPYAERVCGTGDPKDMADAILRLRPGFYSGTKSALLSTARYIRDNNIDVSGLLKCVSSSSEILTDNDRSILEEAFKNEVFDIYGCEEMGQIAVETAPKMHMIWNDSYVVNVYNRKDISPGKYKGDICVTSLIHTKFPRVNYLIGDEVEITEKDGIKYITDITGRSNDLIKNEDGTDYSWSAIYRIMEELTDIIQYRVIQKDYKNLVFVLAADIDDNRKRCLEEIILKRADERFYGEKKNIKFEWCESIPIDASGKLRVLISEIDEEKENV